MIQCEHITKQFQRTKKDPPLLAVEDLSLEVKDGEVFGFLGPNGAGKTTTIRMLCSLIAPTSGRAFIDGFEVGKNDREIRQRVGILTETPGMYDRLSAHKNLSIYAQLYGIKDVNSQVEKHLRMLGLWERRYDEVGSFSKGMRQKLAIARAFIHEPAILFLDEPTSGLDPESARMVRDFILELKTEGRTIFLCTHNLEEADRLCQRIAIFKKRLITVDSPAALREKLYGRKIVFHVKNIRPEWVDILRAFPFVRDALIQEGKLVASLADPETENPILIRRLVEAGAEVQFVGEIRHSLEEIYMEMMRP